MIFSLFKMVITMTRIIKANLVQKNTTGRVERLIHEIAIISILIAADDLDLSKHFRLRLNRKVIIIHNALLTFLLTPLAGRDGSYNL